jgi:hypothetical protein
MQGIKIFCIFFKLIVRFGLACSSSNKTHLKQISMEKFMYLFVEDATQTGQASPEEMQAGMQKWFDWIDKLKATNQYDSGEPLLPSGKIIKGANKVVTDGPFAESKELVSGYFIVMAKDIDHATEMAMD